MNAIVIGASLGVIIAHAWDWVQQVIERRRQRRERAENEMQARRLRERRAAMEKKLGGLYVHETKQFLLADGSVVSEDE